MPKVLFPLLTLTALAGLVAFWPESASVSQEPIVTETPVAERAVITPVTTAGDRMSHPPIRQTFTAGPYQLVVEAENQWETPVATSEFYQGGTLLWEKDLPHQYGPRFSLVSAQGQVLLLDEFINVASPHALTLLNVEGETLIQKSFEDIQAALGVTPAELTAQATSGWWISSPPAIAPGGETALVQTGGTTLEINLNTGELSRRADL
ncbi:MAG: hypothetical protein AAFP03_09880 [Cyanobacteria bacterium J06598_3]